MTETTEPAWLATAEADRQHDLRSTALFHQQQAEKHAAAINRALAKLGIDPIRPAAASAGVLVPAVLLEPDGERGHYGVVVGWSDRSEQAALLVEDWETEGAFPRCRYSRLLNRVGDVLYARDWGPAAEPEPRRDFRAEALGSIAALRVDRIGADAAAVAESVNGLAAAVLHLADVAARSNERP